MHLVAQLKLRTSGHTRRLLRVACRRWDYLYAQGLAQARRRDRELLACIERSKTGRARVNGGRLQELVTQCCSHMPARCSGGYVPVHSSICGSGARNTGSSLRVALQMDLASYLGLYCAWLNAGKPHGEKPGFPSCGPSTPRAAMLRWHRALDRADSLSGDEGEEAAWRAQVMAGSRVRRKPLAFEAHSAGGFFGIFRRDQDGAWFARLALWDAASPLAAPTRPAPQGSGEMTLHGGGAALPGRAKTARLFPLEMNRGAEALFLGRGAPRTARLIEADGEFYLHVAFEFPDPEPRATDGAILALTRGIEALATYAVLAADGRLVDTGQIDGRMLKALIQHHRAVQAIRQHKGKALRGDRRRARVAEHHLYSAGHQIVDAAIRAGNAQIVLLAEDRQLRAVRPRIAAPGYVMPYRHHARLLEILSQLCAEVGLPAPREQKLYANARTCAGCGDLAEGDEATCASCGTPRSAAGSKAWLLGLSWLRYQQPAERRGESLGAWIKGREAAADD